MTSATLTGQDRRIHPRYRVHLAIEIQAGARSGRLGVSQDASVEGLLFNTRSRFSPGEEVSLTLHLSATEADEAHVKAKILRVQSVDTGSSLPWRYLAAVQFERPIPELEERLKKRVVGPAS